MSYTYIGKGKEPKTATGGQPMSHMPCSCQIHYSGKTGGFGDSISYCPLHAAAPALLAALKEILPSLEHEKIHNGDGYNCQGWRAETVDACTCRVSMVIASIAHAEGKE